MKFIIQREDLLKPLQKVSSALSSRAVLPILGNILLEVTQDNLLLTGTDLEIEMIAKIRLIKDHEVGVTTVSARKFFDICRGLPEKSYINVILSGEKILIHSGRIRFSVTTLPVSDFPKLDNWQSKVEFTVSQKTIKYLIETTHFSMANQDVRYYLNGLLFETEEKMLRTVATDGHRLAVCSMSSDHILLKHSVIIPRKGVIELLRLLDNTNNNNTLLHVKIGTNNMRISLGKFIFTSRLIDGSFPNYHHLLQQKNLVNIVDISCDTLRGACSRAAILSNEKFRGVRLCLSSNQLKITAHNLEHEEVEEIIDITYDGSDIEIGFNVHYILDILNILKCKNVRLLLTDSVSSVQIKAFNEPSAVYIVMPMKL